MSEFNIEEHKKWYESQRPTYELLSNTVKNTLESLIKNAGIDYLSITFRAKGIDNFVEKIDRKNYQNPAQEITDLAGIRVITFIEADALKVNDLIKNSFDIDDSKSLDKSDELGIDKFGYRSFHFVCGLGKARCALPEFELFKDLVCEIQVRTVLQHAWAEIEHDRNYKFAGILPSPIKRRLHLLAGVLEVVDREFDNLALEVDRYSKDISEKTERGDLDIELNTLSFYEYLKNLKKRFDFDIELIESPGALTSSIAELYLFGIKKIEELNNLFNDEFINIINGLHYNKYCSLPYLVTDAMIYADIEKYFAFAHISNTIAFDKEIFDVLVEKYGSEKVHNLFETKNVSVIDWETKGFIFGKLSGRKLNSSKPEKD